MATLTLQSEEKESRRDSTSPEARKETWDFLVGLQTEVSGRNRGSVMGEVVTNSSLPKWYRKQVQKELGEGAPDLPEDVEGLAAVKELQPGEYLAYACWEEGVGERKTSYKGQVKMTSSRSSSSSSSSRARTADLGERLLGSQDHQPHGLGIMTSSSYSDLELSTFSLVGEFLHGEFRRGLRVPHKVKGPDKTQAVRYDEGGDEPTWLSSSDADIESFGKLARAAQAAAARAEERAATLIKSKEDRSER